MQEPRRLRLDDQLCFALYSATNAVTGAYGPLLAKLGLNYPQYLVMLVLWQDGASFIWQLAERLRLPLAVIAPLVDQLEKSGFVERKPDVLDRRRVIIMLTEAGQRLEHSASMAQEAVACRTGLTDSDLAALRDELHAVTEHVVDETGDGDREPVAN